MKTKFFYLTALVSVALASCTTNDYLGDVNNDQAINDGSIQFGTNFKTLTRANAVGADAATKLGNRFVVGGFKTANNGAAYTTIFKDYSVEWAASTAGTTESNTSDWEYVGKTKSVLNTSGDFVQAIKYWDYSDDGTPAHAWYDFIAYSTHMTAANEVTSYATDKVAVSAIDHTKLEDGTNGCYTLEADRDELLDCYVADLVRVPKTDFGKEVTMQFRSLTSKVRVALYETVPGYSVTNVKFYTAHPSTLGGSSSTTTSALIGAFGNKAKYAVYFPSTDSYKAHVKIVSHTDDSYANFGTVITGQLKGAEKLETGGTVYLGRSSNDASYYGTESPFFKQVLPNEEGGALELAVDYDLVPIDGTDGVIHVYGATAHVPATYTKWLANYAYTYIFKISDNSNGWTSTVNTDPAGLFPITFDAIVLDSEEKEQKTITTVALPSITTYQKGHDKTKNEYSATTGNIYAQVYWEDASPKLRNDLKTKGALYTVTSSLGTEISEATVMDALNIIETGTTGRNGIVLTDASSELNYDDVKIPLEDGNTFAVNNYEAAEIVPTGPVSGTKYYAYVYDTDTYTGAYYTAAPADIATADKYYSDPECSSNVTSWTSACYLYQKDPTFIYSATVVTVGDETGWPTGWYKDPDGVTPAAAWDASNVGKTFYKKYTVNHKVYGVKVIKVVP